MTHLFRSSGAVSRWPQGPVGIMRFVCAVDHSEPSLQAARFALELAEKCGAELTFVSVVRLPDGEQYGITEYLRSEHNPDPPGVVVLEAAQNELALLGEQFGRAHAVAITCEVRAGEAATEIVASASNRPVDLIVMGHRSQSRLAQALLGSVARRVLDTAPCPVLIVR